MKTHPGLACPYPLPAHIHVHVVVDDLEELPRLWDPPRLDLGPHRHVVKGDLERARADQLK